MVKSFAADKTKHKGNRLTRRLTMEQKKIIPAFYAIDDNYIPFLHVSLLSLKDKVSAGNKYKIHILSSDVKKEHEKCILDLADENFEIAFEDVSDKIERFSGNLKLRDYYTLTTYYRIFIAGMFPEYDKAVYLDSDTAVLCDVAKLYDTELGDNLIAGVPDGAVGSVPPFQVYTKKVLGIDASRYFNAGIIVMNLKKFREEDFYGQFNALLAKYKFRVAQDQDYLNVLCKDRVIYLPEEWNAMPIRTNSAKKIADPKIVHYNLTAKPWHYENLAYEEYFWNYAKKSPYYDYIVGLKNAFTEEDKKRDEECEKGLVALTIEEAENPENYFNKYCAKA